MYRLTLKLKLQVIIKHAIDAGFMFKQMSCKVLSTIKKNRMVCLKMLFPVLVT